MTVTLYYNPQCGKCRTGRQLLEQQGAELEVVEYLKMPPDETTLRDLLRKLGIPARELLREHDPLYKTLGMADPALTEDDILRTLLAHPQLMHRPIAVKGNRAIIGRPPEKLLELT